MHNYKNQTGKITLKHKTRFPVSKAGVRSKITNAGEGYGNKTQ